MQLEKLIDAVMLEDLPDSDFDHVKPYEPEEDIFDGDFEQDPDFHMDRVLPNAAAYDAAPANAH